MSDPVLFTLAALALLLTPGPTNTLLAMAGAAKGMRASLWLMPAELGGYLLTIHVLGLGMGEAVQAAPRLQAGLRLLSSLCLLVIAFRLWRASGNPAPKGPATPGRVFLVTMLNPKALVFAFAILPGLATGNWRAAAPYLLGLSLLIAGASFAWLMLGAMGGRLNLLTPRRIHLAGACILLLFALLLAASGFRMPQT